MVPVMHGGMHRHLRAALPSCRCGTSGPLTPTATTKPDLDGGGQRLGALVDVLSCSRYVLLQLQVDAHAAVNLLLALRHLLLCFLHTHTPHTTTTQNMLTTILCFTHGVSLSFQRARERPVHV